MRQIPFGDKNIECRIEKIVKMMNNNAKLLHYEKKKVIEALKKQLYLWHSTTPWDRQKKDCWSRELCQWVQSFICLLTIESYLPGA